MRFEALIAKTLAMFAELSCEPLRLPENMAHIERKEVDGVLVMSTQFFAVGDKGELRLVHICAPKINVVTLFFFPKAHWQLPVYCMELVIFNEQPIVALLDSVCLVPMICTERVRQWLSGAHQANPHLQQAIDTPEWFAQCRSQQDFFLRPDSHAEMDALIAVHLQLLEPFKQLLQQAQRFSEHNALAHHDCLLDYKNHHRIHAPGWRLIKRSFGEQWANSYMSYFFH